MPKRKFPAEKQEHQRLASIVKGVHRKLREEFLSNNDCDTVWENHVSNQGLLKDYASAMHTLATDHWDGASAQSRITWCRQVCRDYFVLGGCEKALEKDSRKVHFHQDLETEIGSGATSDIATSCSKDGEQTIDGVRMKESYSLPSADNKYKATLSPKTIGNSQGTDNISQSQPVGHRSSLADDMKSSVTCCGQKFDSKEVLQLHRKEVLSKYGGARVHMFNVPKSKNIRLLDVGSCFNPFSAFDEFDATGIDISPATESVLMGDFLSMEIVSTPAVITHATQCVREETNSGNRSHGEATGQIVINSDISGALKDKKVEDNVSSFKVSSFCPTGKPLESTSVKASEEVLVDAVHLDTVDDTVDDVLYASYLNSLRSPVQKLPRNLFHVVVFCLLLEYLPAPQQRWRSCIKANQLLCRHGILLIITPDSSHQGRRVQQMKDWRQAIESLGFIRYRYEKLEHLHCMAFRKLQEPSVCEDSMADKLYIPQDFNTAPSCDVAEGNVPEAVKVPKIADNDS